MLRPQHLIILFALLINENFTDPKKITPHRKKKTRREVSKHIKLKRFFEEKDGKDPSKKRFYLPHNDPGFRILSENPKIKMQNRIKSQPLSKNGIFLWCVQIYQWRISHKWYSARPLVLYECSQPSHILDTICAELFCS